MDDQHDARLWKVARRRAEFRRSLYSYLIVNTLLWCIWWLTSDPERRLKGFPWPFWVMILWGFSVARQYFHAYYGTKSDLVDKEFDQLKNENR
ncbi:2TM domain-containing protein [Segetibacter sp. 3557_3]|uniref:2TM domain-containing protein n=1 Tax=Segetibacter sp. 3557_3 TaxID=2547429 RepID=UPI0010590D99|nr:2TM domain-containing protein [Segetibacter sp. 3557_3]TDH26189.1 2TM domain-containing protein [Segetibacter sp. 3557_3]